MRSVALAFLLALTVSACRENEAWEGRVYTENGIDYVQNTGHEAPGPRFTLSRAASFGGSENIAGLPLHKVRDVAPGPEGTFVIADGGNTRILVLNTNGDLISSFGSAGEGPGEFATLSSLDVEGDHAYVYDSKLRTVSVFNLPQGDYVRSFPVKQSAVDIIAEGDRIYLPYFNFGGDGLYAVYDSSGQSLGTQGLATPESTSAAQAGEAGRVVANGDEIMFAHAYPYRVESYGSNGEMRQVILRDDNSFQPPFTPAGTPEGLGASLLAKINGLGLLDGGITVVQVALSDAAPRLDLFDAEGRFLQSLELPEGHQLAAVAGSTLYTYVYGGDDAFAEVAIWTLTEDDI